MGCSAKGVGGEAESLWGHVLIRRILGLATRAYAAQAESRVATAPAEGSLAPTKGCRGAAEGVTSARWTRAGHDAAPVREHGFWLRPPRPC